MRGKARDIAHNIAELPRSFFSFYNACENGRGVFIDKTAAAEYNDSRNTHYNLGARCGKRCGEKEKKRRELR